MKKIISFILIAAILLSALSVTAFADNEKPESTSGPATSIYMYGGARAGIYDLKTERQTYVVGYDYDTARVEAYNDAVPGMTYDFATNTLTVDNVHQKENQLFIWYMGDDFKLNVVGENEFGVIYVYNYFNFHSTSLNIVGSGKLTVNEERINQNAVYMFADGGPLMKLDIADTANVNFYSQKKSDEGEEYYPVVSLNKSSITPEMGGAITSGGKAVPEAKSNQIVVEDTDYVPVAKVETPDTLYNHGFLVKSKSDPDNIYSMIIQDGVLYIVSRYIYLEDLGVWAADRSFADNGMLGKRYDKEGFEAEYDYVDGMAPTKIDYMSKETVKYRGTEAIRITKDSEPDAVYTGQPIGGLWGWDENYSGNYQIKRVVWDDNQEMYVEDTSFEPIDLMANELEENGYHLMTETVEKHLTLTVWTSADPFDVNRFDITAPSMTRKSDPDGLYVKLGTYGDDEGILVYKVHYNPGTEEHYVEYNEYDEPECMWVSYADLESGESDFSYDTETVNEAVTLRFLRANYNLKWDLSPAVQIEKKGDPDTVYAYRQWTHVMEDNTEREEYGIMRLLKNEKLGCYYEDESFDLIVFYDPADLKDMGYTVLESEQHLEYSTKGRLELSEYPAYTDNNGGRYYVTYDNEVLSYNDEDVITLWGNLYHFGTPAPELSKNDLNDTKHDIVTDYYSYWIDGPEYHLGGEQPEPTEYSLWVNGEQIKSDHLTVTCGEGKATFNPSTNTLTLDNAQITKGVEADQLYTGILSYLPQLSIVVQGDCTIIETGGDGIGSYNFESYQIGDVIYAAPYDITVCGEGTLTINESTPLYGYGMYCTGNLVIDGITLNITSASSGVWASSLEMRDTNADIHCTTGFSGIVVNRGDFAFENSTVEARSDEGTGLLLGGDTDPGNFTVSSGEMKLGGKIGVQSIDEGSKVIVNDGRLVINASDAAFDQSFLADNAKNIIMGEGIGVTSGAIDGKTVVISKMGTGSLSGKITSFNDPESVEEGTITLKKGEETVGSKTFKGNSNTYSFEGIEDGEYTLVVGKKDHVERTYNVTVSGETRQDVKIHLIGDINGDGKITIFDFGRANSHVKKVSTLTGYDFACADTLKPYGTITILDAGRINSHMKKVSYMWVPAV